MTTSALLLGLALQTQAAGRTTLQYYQGEFQIGSRGTTQTVPLEAAPPKSPAYIAYRSDDAFAVWDSRGLTCRNGDTASSTHLPEIAVSPRIFSRQEILQTLQRVQDGECTKEASALSGAKRIGKNAYFLVRWDDAAGKPWAEALIQVNLAANKPRPELLGKFDGLSTATRSIDDKLTVAQGKLAIVEHTPTTWGLATYDPESRQFRFQTMGGVLTSYTPLNPVQGLFIETSSYGTTIAGRVDLITGTRKILYEGREQIRFIDGASPEVVLAASPGKSKLIDCVTGSVRTLPYEVHARRTDKNIVLWSPPKDPVAAWLMSPTTWTTLATWRPGSGSR